MPHAQQRTHAGLQFQAMDGLRQEVVAAGFDGLGDVARLVERRDHQHGDVARGLVLLQPLANFVAAQFGHHNVEQN